MACSDVAGNTWVTGRLLFDNAADAVLDVRPILGTPGNNGNFEGSFKDANGNAIDDRLVNGRCTQQNNRQRIDFTRQHLDGTVTTYTGRVTKVPSGEVLIRGRFDRTIMVNSVATTLSGDYETEKPT